MVININPSALAFAGSPIIVTAKNEAGDWAASNANLRMVHVKALVSMNGKSRGYEFAAETSVGETFLCDVSSAVRSVMHGIDYMGVYKSSATTLYTGKCQLTVSAWVSYMSDGSYFSGLGNTAGGSQTCSSVVSVFPGRLSDMEILKGVSVADGMLLSNKPSSGEVLNSGHISLMSMLSNGAPSLSYQEISSGSSILSVGTNSRNIYVDDKVSRTEFLFVNSRGVLEDASAVTLESMSVDVNKEEFILSGSPSYETNMQTRSRRANPRMKWEMSSGNVERDWAKWWAIEFLSSDRYWMKLDGIWMPVSVTAKGSSVSVYDRSKAQALHIDFTVTSSLRG